MIHGAVHDTQHILHAKHVQAGKQQHSSALLTREMGGRFFLNFALTAPILPCARVTCRSWKRRSMTGLSLILVLLGISVCSAYLLLPRLLGKLLEKLRNCTDCADGWIKQVQCVWLLLMSNSRAGLLFCGAYFAPDDPELRSLLLCLGFVDVCYPFAEVEFCLRLAGNTVNLDQRSVVCLVRFTPAE